MGLCQSDRLSNRVTSTSARPVCKMTNSDKCDTGELLESAQQAIWALGLEHEFDRRMNISRMTGRIEIGELIGT